MKNNQGVLHDDGSRRWYRNGELHRDNDLPAAIDYNGSCFWYQNGKLHRDNDLPAVEWNDGARRWFLYDKYIRAEPPCPIRAEAIRMRVSMEQSDE